MKKIVLPLTVVAEIKENGVLKILESNGFDMRCNITVNHDMHKNINVYEQEGD